MLLDAQRSQLDEAIAIARSRFLESLDDRILELDALVVHCRNADDPSPALRQIARNAHKIAGLAPTLGLEALGDCARNAESAAVEVSSGSSHGDLLMVLDKVEQLMDRMEDSVTS